MLRRLLKLLHEIGAVGVMGAYAACLVLMVKTPTRSLVAYAAMREGVAAIAQWLLLPSLAIVLISGLLAIAATPAYQNAGWAWFKALLGISLFEGTLLTVVATAHEAAALAESAASGHSDPARLAAVLHTQWGGLWMMLGLSFANIVLAVWRPRFGRRVPGSIGEEIDPTA
jgi:hypothetical protein